MRRDLLLEIGTEEMPARVLPSVLTQLGDLAGRLFKEERLTYQDVAVYGTPRRLVLYVSGLAETQEELIREIKGPPVRAAFTADGQPTRAALGFAQNQGVAVEELVTRTLPGGEYVFALKKEAGRPALEALPGILIKMIQGLSFPRPMRWGDLELKFIRPIRWLLALFGPDVVPLNLEGLKADRLTYGHRFLAPGPHLVTAPEAYFKVLEENYVIVDHRLRRRLIWEQVENLAHREGGRVKDDPELLEEITFLVEYPTAVCGRLAEEYLKLPPEVVTTPMREHQRYFPVWDGRGEKLLPLFIAVHNGTGEHTDKIRAGYEKVLKARLADASFFYEEDRKTPLASKVEKLAHVLFQENLGTMLDKVERLKKLAVYLACTLDLPEGLWPTVERTAELAKADLATNMVYEFPELQGIMGSYYAAADGEDEEVCRGIRQHYWPRFAGDRLPDSLAGMVVGLADRLDTLVGCFAVGLIPSGSQDPFGLRRCAWGLAATAVELGLHFSLAEAIAQAYDTYTAASIRLPQPLGQTAEELQGFLRGRLEHILEEKGIRYDVAEAVLAVGWDDLAGAYHRARDLEAFRRTEGFPALLTAFTRAFNLARQAQEEYEVEPGRLEEEAERRLYHSLAAAEGECRPYLAQGNYLGALERMADLRGPIDNFFDRVLVMAPDPWLRRNRLALLQRITRLVLQVADFSRLLPD
ncbi:glycine--tRNA ligase subunit beta [Thermanaeromonas sp. C210]|uniref:glycine--tRNA ligase subunit beta n=1 Tax=Thermanaeromonas sp. C210 TaxID=2731925 RepID=UPI00155CD7FD|nr:glycine--tRNA ligase subunit beta [Thermanaeromonas sp. C210]GFN22502.1 glycine--tRNA ligase beta subunit [Thermanaeromonas sp. C210]